MSMSNTVETEVAEYIFNATAPSWAGNANFWIALHTANPGEAGSAVTSEATYTGYARKVVVRATGFDVVGDTTSNAADLEFDPCTAGSDTITYWSVVDTASGAGKIIVSAALTASRNVSAGIAPKFTAGSLTIVAD